MLSPACASTDQFRNFQQRGGRFVELVDHWAEIERYEGVRMRPSSVAGHNPESTTFNLLTEKWNHVIEGECRVRLSGRARSQPGVNDGLGLLGGGRYGAGSRCLGVFIARPVMV